MPKSLISIKHPQKKFILVETSFLNPVGMNTKK